MSTIEEVMDAVISMANETNPFAPVHRGALKTAPDVCCELDPSAPLMVFMTKNTVVPLAVVFNAKHQSLDEALEVLHAIHRGMAKRKNFPSTDRWQIVDIAASTAPRKIGRESDNTWLTACELTVKIFDKE